MKHRVGFNRLDRKSSHRQALLRNMSASLLTYERITTTKAKAKEVRRTVERMITRAKVDSVHNRREVSKLIGDQGVVAKLFTDIAPRFVSRPGGYTRILKIGHRNGDAAEMVILELVERVMPEKKAKKAKTEVEDTAVEAKTSSEPEITPEPEAENEKAESGQEVAPEEQVTEDVVEDEAAKEATEEINDEVAEPSDDTSDEIQDDKSEDKTAE